MTTKTKLAPMKIKVEDNKVLCNKFGNDFIDLLGDLGWDYQRMSRSGRETYDEIRRASTAKLKSILKNDNPDVDLHDMIDYELYIREYS